MFEQATSLLFDALDFLFEAAAVLTLLGLASTASTVLVIADHFLSLLGRFQCAGPR